MNDIKGIIEDVEKSDLVSKKVIKRVIEIIGQEKWQDIYDEEGDICTTTGELIITIKGIAELEKENAELKEYLNEKENTVHTLDVLHKEAVRKYGEVNEQLTKAKELLNEFMRISEASDEDFEHDYSELIGETEQFLSEMEKC